VTSSARLGKEERSARDRFQDEERIKDLPDGKYVIVVGERTKPDKVPTDWTKRRSTVKVETETRVS
jgi:hypothetical protein